MGEAFWLWLALLLDRQAGATIVVTAKEPGPAAVAASAGEIAPQQLELRPIRRAGDVLESIPGVVVSQHSGEGKANQYYLRGFNLDHGTDLAITVAGAPVNMPTHAHGQGYADANFVIPELIGGVQYRKGPYYADEGDFASAGAVNIDYVSVLDRPIASLTGGTFGYRRALVADSRALGGGALLGALELSRNDGPWVHPDAYDKLSAVLRYTGGDAARAYSVTLAAYDGRWNATDQVPDRALRDGLPRYGGIDASDGGRSHRYSAVADWQSGGTKVSAYAIGYGLDLFSNFTYFLDDPDNGDQFEQRDRRVVVGGRATYETSALLLGAEVRRDHIGALGLYHTRGRQRLETVRADRLDQTSGALFAQSTLRPAGWLRIVAGLRGDAYQLGPRGASILSPKLSVILGPWRGTELYASAGGGFHSNDARAEATPLVRTTGAEVGLRTSAVPRLQSAIALWALDTGSELVFAGDAGTTEARGASRRRGVEWSNELRLTGHLAADADVAYSRARFASGERIPGAVEGVVSAGLSLSDLGRVSGSVRLRALGPRPLTEDDSVRSSASRTVNAEVRYALTPRLRIGLEALNLGNARASDIDYFYRSRLPGEPPGGVDDVHTHPLEPRAVRLRIETTF